MDDFSIRRCKKCGQEKPLGEFVKRSDSGARRHECRVCYAASHRSERVSPERRAAAQAVRQAGLQRANEKKREEAAKRRQEALAAGEADQRSAVKLQRYRTDPEYRARRLADLKRYASKPEARAKKKLRTQLSDAKRRAAKRVSTSHISITEWKQKVALYEGRCHWCRELVNGNPQMDHVIPLSKGGLHTLGNIVPSCRSCNSSKGAKLPHQWRGRLI